MEGVQGAGREIGECSDGWTYGWVSERKDRRMINGKMDAQTNG